MQTQCHRGDSTSTYILNVELISGPVALGRVLVLFLPRLLGGRAGACGVLLEVWGEVLVVHNISLLMSVSCNKC
jgi:hypothetical protein